MTILPASALRPEAQTGLFHGMEQRAKVAVEQPYHRHAAYMLAMGADTKEVASELNVTRSAVNNWLRESWFQARVSEIMAERGGRDLTLLFAAEAFSSLGVMLELRDNVKTSSTVRAGICRDILDRALGKPTQRVETVSVPTSDDPTAEVARLENENNRLRQQQPN